MAAMRRFCSTERTWRRPRQPAWWCAIGSPAWARSSRCWRPNAARKHRALVRAAASRMLPPRRTNLHSSRVESDLRVCLPTQKGSVRVCVCVCVFIRSRGLIKEEVGSVLKKGYECQHATADSHTHTLIVTFCIITTITATSFVLSYMLSMFCTHHHTRRQTHLSYL